MTWTDEFATAVRGLYREEVPGIVLSAEGMELSLGYPVYLGDEIAPVKVLIEQAWIEQMRDGAIPNAAARVLVDSIVELLSKPPGEGPVGLVLLEGHPPPKRRRVGHVSSPMYFSVPRRASPSGEGEPPEKPCTDDNPR